MIADVMFIIADIAIVIWLIYLAIKISNLTIKISHMQWENAAAIKRLSGMADGVLKRAEGWDNAAREVKVFKIGK